MTIRKKEKTKLINAFMLRVENIEQTKLIKISTFQYAKRSFTPLHALLQYYL